MGGDIDWNNPIKVVGGKAANLILSRDEAAWLNACCKAAGCLCVRDREPNGTLENARRQLTGREVSPTSCSGRTAGVARTTWGAW